MHAIKRLKNKTVSIIITIAVIASLLCGALFAAPRAAKAETNDDTVEFDPTSVSVGNAHFSSSSGSYPATPDSWSGAAMDGGSANVVSGVVDLTASTYFGTDTGNKKFKLDQYPEYANESSMPQTIFGAESKYKDSDAKTLMINTAPGAEAAYGYTSSDMSLAPNAFYRISAWVKTSDFASDTGATVKITGLGQSLAFLNINTVRNIEKKDGIPVLTVDNNYGWAKYTFYIKSSASLTKTAKLVLGIGNGGDADDELPEIQARPAHGYAFFDTVTAERITAYDFATETFDLNATDTDNVYSNTIGTILAVDLYETESLTVNDTEIGTFSDKPVATENWWKSGIAYDEHNDDQSYMGTANSILYNSESRVDTESNPYGFTANPWAPFGRAEYESVGNNPMISGTNTANIMLISTYDGSSFGDAAYGISSPSVNIKRFKYYRFGVWVKGDSIENGSGITLRLTGKQAKAKNKYELAVYENLAGDSEDKMHYGWKEQVVYIQGSMYCDYDINFELWLGTPDSKSRGIAMFDNATFTEISYTEYVNMSEADGGNKYTLDDDHDETGVTNGNFSSVGDYDEIKFPLPVAEWTYITPTTANTKGFAVVNEPDLSRAVHGILPTDNELFSKLAADGVIPGVKNPATMANNLNKVLLLSSNTQTAFGYQSPSVTLATDQANKLSVELAVDGVVNGYGASLVLKTVDGDVISTIENITTTNNAFKTYTFYLAAPLSEQSVMLEIWLGLNDRIDNTRKLSNGNVYVRRVALDSWTAADDSSIEQEFADKLAEYKTIISSSNAIKSLDFGIYSFSAPSFDYYDIYSYGNDGNYGTLYQWNMSSAVPESSKSGMFNVDNLKDITVYNEFDKKDLSGNMLYIFNTDKNRTTYTYANTLSLVANMYYRIDIPVKVRVTDDVRTDKTSVGANIKLTGTGAEFANIKDTTTLVAQGNEESRDYETFKMYTFYISTGSDGGDIGLEIAFGGEDRASYIQGKLVVGNITMTEIDNVAFETAENEDNAQAVAVRLSETSDSADSDDNTEATSSEMQWWIIPTIIFSAALIAVIIIIIVVRIRDRVKSKKKTTYTTEYDRSDVIRDIERLQAEQNNNTQTIDANKIEEVPDYDDDDVSSTDNIAEETETIEGSNDSEDAPKATESSDEVAEPTAKDELDD